MATNSIKLLTGNSHPDLAKLVADRSVSATTVYPSTRKCGQLTKLCGMRSRLGIELTKIMVLQYSNQETSVTIGESVRDEDGTPPLICPCTPQNPNYSAPLSLPSSLRSPIYRAR